MQAQFKRNWTSKSGAESENCSNLPPALYSLAANWDTQKKISQVGQMNIFQISLFAKNSYIHKRIATEIGQHVKGDYFVTWQPHEEHNVDMPQK